MDDELLPVVELDGTVSGFSTRSRCHSGSMLRHPVVHLHVIGADGSLLLQKRSLTKFIQPGKWDTAVGGHVAYGESISEALQREAFEEIGLCAFEPELLMRYEFRSEVEMELIYCFAAKTDSRFIPVIECGEADELRFWNLDDIERLTGKEVFTPNFEQEYNLIKEKLYRL